MPDEEIIRRVDKALLEYIYAQTGTMICNLSVARVGIAAMREPTEKQYDALCATNKLWKELSSYEVWTTYIDAILK